MHPNAAAGQAVFELNEAGRQSLFLQSTDPGLMALIILAEDDLDALTDVQRHKYLHGIALTSWFALALVQPWLIRSRRAGLHRKLGVIGAALAVSVVLTGIWTLVIRDAPEIDQYPTRAAGNLASLLMFSSYVSFGLFFRKESKRTNDLCCSRLFRSWHPRSTDLRGFLR